MRLVENGNGNGASPHGNGRYQTRSAGKHGSARQPPEVDDGDDGRRSQNVETQIEVACPLPASASASASATRGASSANGLNSDRRPKGSRTVKHLTPSQLEKKRANDREAQRSIRERARQKMEYYENRIKELEALGPNKEMQALRNAVTALQSENEGLKRRLSEILTIIIQSPSGAGNVSPSDMSALPRLQLYTPVESTFGASAAHHPSSLATPTSGISSLDMSVQTIHPLLPNLTPQQQHHLLQQHNQWLAGNGISRTGDASGSSSGPGLQRVPSSIETSPQSSLEDTLSPELYDSMSPGPGPSQSIFPGQFAHQPQQRQHQLQYSQQHPLQHPNRYTPAPPQLPWPATAQDRHPPEPGVQYGGALDPNVDRSLDPRLSLSHTRPESTQSTAAPLAGGHCVPSPLKNCAATCAYDSVILDFLAERRQRLREGMPMPEVLGPSVPWVRGLLAADEDHGARRDPDLRTQPPHPVSKIITDILQTFPDISGLAERVAVMSIMFHVMRWCIDPSPDNHARLPRWARPGHGQLTRLHPTWVDTVPFPAMRELIAQEYPEADGEEGKNRNGGVAAPSTAADSGRLAEVADPPAVKTPFDNFFIPFCSTLSLNWPFKPADCLVETPGSDWGSDIAINPVFECHFRKIENWSLGPAFDRSFPHLKGSYNLRG